MKLIQCLENVKRCEGKKKGRREGGKKERRKILFARLNSNESRRTRELFHVSIL
jgi:hypothetical protein